MIYLDNAATTKMRPEVVEAMMPFLKEEYGNPNSIYPFGRNAFKAMEEARRHVAELINCRPEQIIFTSGGSEANSLVFGGLRTILKDAGKTHILISSIEHPSVINAARELRIKDGFDVNMISVKEEKKVSKTACEGLIRDDTGLVSVMYMNNETGTINQIQEIAELCHSKGILFHTDCVQAAGYINLDVEQIGCDFMSISSHKIHGPKGVGALYIKNPIKLAPIIYGSSSQELGLRGGTQNVAGIVGFGEACRLAVNSAESEQRIGNYYHKLSTAFISEIIEAMCDYELINRIHYNSPGYSRKIINLRIDDVDSESLVLFLGQQGVCVSAGSACSSLESVPSRTLMAFGLTEEQARHSIRISFSEFNTIDEVRLAARKIGLCAKALTGQY